VSAALTAAERPRLKLAEQQEGFISHIGPVYETQLAGGWRRVLPLDRRHLGADGTVHGGAISAFADFVAWRAIADSTNGTPPRVAPIQTSLQYLGVAKSGQWLYGEGLLLKQSQGLYHVTVELFTAERSVATASALWKAFR
jgi:acyl-coenzyme A thioesterase PaaI-like protein